MKNGATQTCVLYLRVSSKDQEKGYSLDAQEKLLEAYAKKCGFRIAKIYRISESASGKQVRKIFNQMLKFAEEKGIDHILCEKVDRLTRNPKDATSVSDWINEDDQRKVHFVKENFVLDKNTRAHENLVWDMKVAIARFYTNNLSEEVRKGQKEKLAQGWLPRTAPLGYKTVGEEGQKIHIVDERFAPYIKKAFELYATGNYSLNKLNNELYENGMRSKQGKRVSKSLLHQYLQNPFYIGYNRWKGQVTKGKQEPLVTEELFDRVQTLLGRNTNGAQYKKHSPLFQGLITCEVCSGSVTWQLQKGAFYGNCNDKTCEGRGERYLKNEDIEKEILPMLTTIAPRNKRVLDWLERALKESHKDEIDFSETKRTALNAEFEKLQKRIERLYEDKLDGVIDANDYQRRYKRYTAEQESVRKELDSVDEGSAKYYEAGFAIHELALKAEQIYHSKKATVDERRLLLSYVFSNITRNQLEIKADYTAAFEFLAEWMPRMNETFELQESIVNKAQTASLETVRSTMQGRQDSNPRRLVLETSALAS